jgi:predicted pyridoxine 5'-phosphate oxidase superfamily flavin-nucleotide-binding protein
MGILTTDMQRIVEEQRLGFVATVCPDGTPNVSPKGTTAVWDDDHLVFADIRSPRTIKNLRANPSVEINVVDPIVRKGYRFKGTAEVFAEGPRFEEIVAFYRRRGSTSPIRSGVLVRVERALPLVSPAYDTGATEDEVRTRWQRHMQAPHPAAAPKHTTRGER